MARALVPPVDNDPDAPPILTLSVPPPWPMVATRISIYCAPLTFTSSGTVVALVTGATGTRLAVAKVEVTRVPPVIGSGTVTPKFCEPGLSRAAPIHCDPESTRLIDSNAPSVVLRAPESPVVNCCGPLKLTVAPAATIVAPTSLSFVWGLYWASVTFCANALPLPHKASRAQASTVRRRGRGGDIEAMPRRDLASSDATTQAPKPAFQTTR